MKVYHGTSSTFKAGILREGIRPRGTGKGNWSHTVDSNPDHVYLTSAYSGFFADKASGQANWLIVEVETDLLDCASLFPDEDFLEQIERYPGMGRDKTGIRIPTRCKDMLSRTAWCRKNLARHRNLWQHSVKLLGNCSHRGTVPLSAVTRIVEFDPRTNPFVAWACADPLIVIDNFVNLKDKYHALTSWFFGDAYDPEPLVVPAAFSPEVHAAQLKFLEDRSGITVVL